MSIIWTQRDKPVQITPIDVDYILFYRQMMRIFLVHVKPEFRTMTSESPDTKIGLSNYVSHILNSSHITQQVK